MTINQASKRIGISPSKLYGLVAERKITHYRIGGKILLQEDDVATFMNGCKINAATPSSLTPRPRLKHITLSGS